MKGHNYQVAKFKCVDCEFVGTNEYTMEVHIGKYHTDVFECVICDYIADTEENLDILLFTCEIYECTGSYGSFPKRTNCNLSGKDISEMKEHLDKEHEGTAILKHIKLSTTNQEEVSFKGYHLEEL